jgi:hypothetical protein
VAGNLDHVRLFAGHGGVEKVEGATFLHDQVEAEVAGGAEDGGFLCFVVELGHTARVGSHEDEAQAMGGRRLWRQGLADAADGAKNDVLAQRPVLAVGGEQFPGRVEKGASPGRVVVLGNTELDQERDRGGVQKTGKEVSGTVEPGEQLLAELEESRTG